jgi:hypothetical protein
LAQDERPALHKAKRAERREGIKTIPYDSVARTNA